MVVVSAEIETALQVGRTIEPSDSTVLPRVGKCSSGLIETTLAPTAVACRIGCTGDCKFVSYRSADNT